MELPAVQPSQESTKEVLRYFRDKELRQPGSLDALANRLWEDLDIHERFGLIAVQTVLFEASLEDKEQLSKSFVLTNFLTSSRAVEYIESEQAEIRALDEAFTANTALPPNQRREPLI